MDRGAALNCRVVHNWDQKKEQAKKQEQENSQENKVSENQEKTDK